MRLSLRHAFNAFSFFLLDLDVRSLRYFRAVPSTCSERQHVQGWGAYGEHLHFHLLCNVSSCFELIVFFSEMIVVTRKRSVSIQ